MLSMDVKSLPEQNRTLTKRIGLILLLTYRRLLAHALSDPVGHRYNRPGDGRKHHCHAAPNRLFTWGGTTTRSTVLYPAFAVIWQYNSDFRREGR